MDDRVKAIAERISEKVVGYRRDFHRYAEVGWTEFRTASLVARRLLELGYDVEAGRGVIREADRMGVPSHDVLEACWRRAREQGGDVEFLDLMRGGFTGVVASCGDAQGKTVGMRFDMDALEVTEADGAEHPPAREGFASVNHGVMHACGHDVHTAIGLGVAEILREVGDSLRGRVKLIFQPAEEGVRGARSMVGAGVLDDVDFLLGLHVYSRWKTGQIAWGMNGGFATSKFDAELRGSPAHAGSAPHEGNNALLAAATAVLNLHAIPRHRAGASRINVGRLTAGTGRNVVSPTAHLVVETRGATTTVNDFMYEQAVRVLESAAAMHGCTLEIREMGAAQSADSDPELAERVSAVGMRLGGFTPRDSAPTGGSEDFTYMMTRVQSRGGLATHMGVGARTGGAGHHTSDFDIDEEVISLAMALLASTTLDLLDSS
jgi:aminobenzoyl-glutamate utilization protein A